MPSLKRRAKKKSVTRIVLTHNMIADYSYCALKQTPPTSALKFLKWPYEENRMCCSTFATAGRHEYIWDCEKTRDSSFLGEHKHAST